MIFKLRWTKNIFFLGLLVFSCFCSGVRIEVGSIGISVTHLILPIVLVYVIGEHLKRKVEIVLFRDNVSLLLYLIWGVSIVSTILYSGFPTRSITGAVNFTFFIILFLTSRWLMSLSAPDQMLKSLMTSAKTSAWVGLIFLIVALISSQTNLGATYEHINKFNVASVSKPIPSIRSLAIEPNLFGIVTACVLAIFVAIYLTWDRSRKCLVNILLLGTALILSYTRSAFLGIGLSVILMALISKQGAVIIRTFQIAAFAIFSIVILLTVLPEKNSFKKAIAYKLGSGMFDVSKGTAIPRLISINESLKGFAKHPILGNGIFSANNVFVNPNTGEVTGTAGPIGWLNGLFIQALHDTGLIGVIIWFFFFVFLLYRNYKVYKKLPPSFEKSILLGFIGGNFIILVGSQASSLVWISFPYVFWAINLTVIKKIQNQYNSTAL